MFFLSIVHHYLLWHYSRAFYELFRVWLNLLEFVFHFFSIPQLMRSWLSPWKRMTEKRTKKWDMQELMETVIVNLLSRLVGAIMRTAIIIAGLISLLTTTIVGFAVYTLWVAAPLMIFLLLAVGVAFLLA